MNARLTGWSLVLTLVVILQPALLPNATEASEVKTQIVEALNAGDTAQAIDLLTKEIDIDKGYFLNYYTLGLIYFNRNEYAQAKEQFKLALEKKGKHFESMYRLGLCHFRLNELDEAEEVMEKGRRKAKKLQKAWFEDGYGLVMMARENYRDADRAFRAALVLDSTNAEYHIHLGDANFYQGIPSLAIIEYEKALKVDTASTEVYYHWAEACLEMKDYACAIEKLHVVLQKDSTYANAWMRAAGIYFKAALSTRARDEREARFMDAIGSYKRFLELSKAEPDSTNVRVFFELAMAYLNIRGAEDAVKYFEDVLSIPYEARDIYFHYGKALWGVQDFVKSGEALQRHVEWASDPDNAGSSKVKESELYQYLGDSYYYREEKDFGKAIKYYQKSVDANPNQKRILYNLAVAYHNEKRFGSALECYQKRVDLGIDSASAGIYKNAGYCALSIANREGDEEEMDDLDEAGDEDVPATGGIDPDLNYYEVAVGYMEKYLEQRPDDAKALLLVANTYLYQLMDCSNGVRYYQQLLTVDPKSCDAKKALGYAYFGGVCTKNYTTALRYLKSAYQCIAAEKGACGDVDLVLWIAQCYHLRAVERSKDKAGSSEDFKNANDWYGKCYKCDPSNQECKKGYDDTSFEF